MSARSLVAVWVLAALAVPVAAAAADQIEVIGTSAGLPPPPPPVAACSAPDCATVVSIVNLGQQWKQVKRLDASGVYVGEGSLMGQPGAVSNLADSGLMTGSPAFSAQDEALAPMEGESGLVRQENLWHIVVRYDDGTTQTLEQNYPPLFQAGARVRVDGRRLQLAQ